MILEKHQYAKGYMAIFQTIWSPLF